MLVTRRFLVGGRVQGVGFRMFVREAAFDEHVAGWVRNCPDGRVEAMAQGPRDAIDRFESHLRRGPSRSRIDDVAVSEIDSQETLTGFRIERD